MAKSQDCAIPDTSMKLSTLVKVGGLMIFRYRTTLTNSSAHVQGKIHFRYRKFGLTRLHRPIFAFNMVKNRPTLSLDVLKDINKYIFK